ncbi:MAG: hypothetical protein IT381_19780 [Deltaproteobacteria bacterium]|nr:hypothetical protein [Deltaproteobacteria bacterium]
MKALVLITSLLALNACAPKICDPREIQFCKCPFGIGGIGMQECYADGSGFGACVCTSVGGFSPTTTGVSGTTASTGASKSTCSKDGYSCGSLSPCCTGLSCNNGRCETPVTPAPATKSCHGVASSCFVQLTCYLQDGCYETGTGSSKSCSGIPYSCSSYASSTSCINQNGCSWY